MTLKIERLSDKRGTRIRLSGEFRSEHLDQLKAEIERGGPRVDLDLQELDPSKVFAFSTRARRRVFEPLTKLRHSRLFHVATTIISQ
jgi:hypothetical protein